MGAKFSYVNAFLCERVLQEADGVLTAIRIVDLFQIPEDTPENAVIQFFLVLSARAVVGADSLEFHIKCVLVRTNGERAELIPDQVVKAVVRFDDPSIPLGIGFAAPIHLKPLTMGTAHLEVFIDDEIVANVPLTLRRLPPQPKSNE